jgi:hypothetical protein
MAWRRSPTHFLISCERSVELRMLGLTGGALKVVGR